MEPTEGSKICDLWFMIDDLGFMITCGEGYAVDDLGFMILVLRTQYFELFTLYYFLLYTHFSC